VRIRAVADGLLFTLGLVLVVGTLTVSGVLAPTLVAGGGSDARTLVGSQGGGTGWHQFGGVSLFEGVTKAWRNQAADSVFEVERLADGAIVTGFIATGAEDCGQYTAPCPRTGFRIIEPGPDGETRSAFSFPVRSVTNSEVHAAEPLPDGGFLVSDMDHERVFVVENGTITWQWNASSFYDAPPDPTRVDWLHINDVNVVAEGRYLVSVRNANQLLVIERGEGVVEVVNEDTGGSDESCRRPGQLRDTDGDGDVRCGDPEVLNHQHNPHWLGEGAVLVADSDNDRVVELRRTDDGWERAWTLRGAGGVAFSWPRDADRLPNGNTLVTDTLNRRIVEVGPNGTVVWAVRTDRIPYEADRLSAGEAVDVPTYDDGDLQADEGELPILSEAAFLSRTVFPWLPFWFRELQLAATVVGLVLMGAGVVVRYRSSV
jgi:hypothetical protein